MIALQRTLEKLPSAFRPAISIAAARVAITSAGFECNENHLETLIDNGVFEWAWNIAGPDATSREVRIFEPCISDYIAWLKDTGASPDGQRPKYPFTAVACALFPSWKQLRSAIAPQVSLAFVCSAAHVTNLIDVGVLAQLPGTAYKRGNGGSAQITWASLETFLREPFPKGRRI